MSEKDLCTKGNQGKPESLSESCRFPPPPPTAKDCWVLCQKRSEAVCQEATLTWVVDNGKETGLCSLSYKLYMEYYFTTVSHSQALHKYKAFIP